MHSAAENIKPGTVIGERYRVVRQLGRGGMGAVFLVEHIHTDEQLALKILNASVASDKVAIERFRREARTPARINSDHGVRVTDADVSAELNGIPFLVMEYLRGEGLEKRVAQLGPLPAEEVVLYLRQVARALDKAHTLGIIHRDLKPENLFLTTREDGTPCVKILDFGIAKITGDASRELLRDAATTTGQIFGTPLYMSPEQAKADSSKVCPQTDVWALGIIAYRLLTARDIWTAETITHLIAQIAYEPMPVPSENGSPLGHDFDKWFAVCCARESSDRYATAGEAVTALSKALGVLELPSTTDRPTGRFILEKLLPPSSAHAVTMADLRADLLGEGTTTLPGAPEKEPTEEETQKKNSAGPLTLTGQLGFAPSTRDTQVRKRFYAALTALAVVAAVMFFLWRSVSQPSPVAETNAVDQDKPAAAPTPTPTATAPAGNAVPAAVIPASTMDRGSSSMADAGASDAGASDAASASPEVTKPAATVKTTTPIKVKRKVVDPLAGRH